MAKVSLRLGVLIAVGLLVAVAVIWRFFFAGGGSPKDLNPVAARIEQHRREGNLAALGKEAAGGDIEAARLAVEALGSSGPAAAPHLERATRHGRSEVREAAAAALPRAAGRDRAARLGELVRGDGSANVRATAASALGRMLAYNEMETLIAALDDKDVVVRSRANEAIRLIAGVRFEYRPGDSEAKRRAAMARVREHWRIMEARVRQYYERGAKKRQP